MADKIFGTGLNPVPLKFTTGAYSELEGVAVPVKIFNLPEPGAAEITPGAAVADATDDTDVVQQLNALLASLRAAGFISE